MLGVVAPRLTSAARVASVPAIESSAKPPDYPSGMAAIADGIAEAHIVMSFSSYGENGELVRATSDSAKPREILGL